MVAFVILFNAMNAKRSMPGCCSIECKKTIHLPLESKKKIRKGVDKGRNVFNKANRD